MDLLRAWHGKSFKSFKKTNNFDICFPLLKSWGRGRWSMHICLLPHPLGIYKDLYLRKDGSTDWYWLQGRWMRIENNLLHVLGVSPRTHLGDSQACSWIIVSELCHQQLEPSKEQWDTEVEREDRIMKLFLCAKAMCRGKQGTLQIPNFGREWVTLIVLWVLNIPVFKLKLFFINLFGLSVSDFELHLSFN